MTRGIIIIADGNVREILYADSDAHVAGLGKRIVDFCDKNAKVKMSLQEVTFGLQKFISGLTLYDYSRNPGLDYVYTMTLQDGCCPRDVVFQHVQSNGDFSCPVPCDLSGAEDLRTEVEERIRSENAYWKRQQELKDSILKCPYCERKGWNAFSPHHAFSPKGERVHCFVDSCPGYSATKWSPAFETAIEEWNAWVEKERARMEV